MAIRINPHSDALLLEQQQAEGAVVRVPGGNRRKPRRSGGWSSLKDCPRFPQADMLQREQGQVEPPRNKRLMLKIMRNKANDESLHGLKRMTKCTNNFVCNERE